MNTHVDAALLERLKLHQEWLVPCQTSKLG
jgi:hypothetical protein